MSQAAGAAEEAATAVHIVKSAFVVARMQF